MQLNLPIITTTQLKDMLRQVCNKRAFGPNGDSPLALIVYGEPGCGKTYAGGAVAHELGWQFATLFAMHYTPSDVGGIRTIDMAKAADALKHYLPDWFGSLDPTKPAIICIDEVTKALLATNNALMGAVHERTIGNHPIPANWVFYMTGNLATSKAGDRDLSPPMRNKIAQVICRNTERDWLEGYAFPHNLDHRVTSMVQFYSDGHDAAFPHGVLSTWDTDEQPAAFASERSLDNMAKMLAAGGDLKTWACAILGNQVGNALIEWEMALGACASPDEVRADPLAAKVPADNLMGHFAGPVLAHAATPGDMEAFYTYLKRFPSEVTVPAMQEIVRRHPECKETAAYIAFKSEYRV